MSALWTQIQDEITRQLAPYLPRIMLAGSQSAGKIQLQDVREATPGSELYAELLPFVPPVGGEAVVLNVGGKPMCAGTAGRTAGPRLYMGSGDPNGAVTADPGSVYNRSDTNGGIQLYVKVSGSGSRGWLPAGKAARRRMLRSVNTYQNASTSASFVVDGFQNGPTVTANASSNADASTGSHLQHDTTSTSGNVASVVAGANSGVRFEWQPDISFGIRTPTTITSMRQWYGLFASSPSGSDDPAIEGFGFRYSTNPGDTNWQTWCNDGTGGGTITDTGISYAASTAQDLRAIVNQAADTVDFYIDGNWVAQHTTNLPAASTVLSYGLYCTTLSAAVRSLRWGRITLESEP